MTPPRPIRGFGIGLRLELVDELLVTARAVDWLEIIAENWIDLGGARARQLDACRERWPMAPHSVTMSIGGPDALDRRFFREVTALCGRIGAPFWSDHVCWSGRGGAHYGDLLPLPFSDEMLAHVVSRIAQAAAIASVPLVFENPTAYVRMPGATMSEAAFLGAIAAQSGAGMLLDVNNVYVNSQNHGFDPEAFVDELPLDRVVQIHVAGHTRTPDVVVDTHTGAVADPVWSLYRHTLRRAGRVIPTLVEWDQGFRGLDAVIDELDRARAEAKRALGDGRAAAAA